MFYFDSPVKDLKAWQLYLGNAFWTLFVGLLLLLIGKILGLFGLDHGAVSQILSKVGTVAQARSPDVLTHWSSEENRKSA